MQLLSVEAIPPYPGAYALLLNLSQPYTITVGRLGNASFPPGTYLYLGSALGPGGLRARLGRHLQTINSQPHWHIDYLRSVAEPKALIYKIIDKTKNTQGDNGTIPLECLWSQAVSDILGAHIPLPGFGSSDCQAGCSAHLAVFPESSQEGVHASSKSFIHHLINILISATQSSPDEIVFMTVPNI